MTTKIQERINNATAKRKANEYKNVLGPKPEWYKNPRNWLIAAVVVPLLGCIVSQIK